jgi:hypothetical protein
MISGNKFKVTPIVTIKRFRVISHVIFSPSPATTMLLVRGVPLLLICLWILTTTNAVLLRFFGLEVQYIEESGLGPVPAGTQTWWLESVRALLQVRTDDSIEETVILRMHALIWTSPGDAQRLLELLVRLVVYAFFLIGEGKFPF